MKKKQKTRTGYILQNHSGMYVSESDSEGFDTTAIKAYAEIFESKLDAESRLKSPAFVGTTFRIVSGEIRTAFYCEISLELTSLYSPEKDSASIEVSSREIVGDLPDGMYSTEDEASVAGSRYLRRILKV